MVLLLPGHLLNLLLIFNQPHSEIIDGYINRMSAYPGDSIELYLNAEKKSKNYNLKLYDLSGKEVTHVQMMVFPQTAAKEKAFETGFGYKPTKKVVVPALRSGVYLWENIFHLL